MKSSNNILYLFLIIVFVIVVIGIIERRLYKVEKILGLTPESPQINENIRDEICQELGFDLSRDEEIFNCCINNTCYYGNALKNEIWYQVEYNENVSPMS